MQSPKEIITAWVAAYNNRDPYALIKLYADDAEVEQVALGKPLRGRKALLESFIALQIADGKIKFQRGYFDKHAWFSRIGLPVC